MLVLAALPAEAQTSGIVLGEGPGKLVDTLIAAGYGSSDLYDDLVNIQNNTTPAVTGVITPAFLATIQACPTSGPIRSTKLSAYAGSEVLINVDCTVQTIHLQPSGFNGLAGTTTLSTSIAGVTAPAAMISFSPAFALDSTHNLLGILYAPSGPSQTFVLSDEAPGHLISNMVAAGYGTYNLYEALVAIQQNANPSLAGVITPSFLNSLALCEAGDPLFTTTLKSYAYSGSAIAVSDDCSVQVRSVQGSTFNGKAGTTSLAVTISGVGPATDVASTSSTPLTSWNQSVPVGSGTATVTYNAFAILYTPGSTSTPVTTPTLSQWVLLLLAGLLAGAGALGLRRGTRHATAAHR